jgi:hypothetical protein
MGSILKRFEVVFMLLLLASCGRAYGDSAIPAADFLNSIGICTHVGQGVDDPAKSAEAMKYAGVRNLRDDASLRHVDDWIAMHKQA